MRKVHLKFVTLGLRCNQSIVKRIAEALGPKSYMQKSGTEADIFGVDGLYQDVNTCAETIY